ncbi:MAG: arginase [Bacilli bacterium]|nr:arginase [Bacilli bacterium]
MKIDLINACSDLGVHVNGSDKGPNFILDNNKLKINKIYSVKKDNVNKSLDINDKEKNLVSLNKFNEELYNVIKESLSSNSLPITLGGDHSVVIASALASISKHKNLGVIWIDSHGDYNNFETTISGNLHGLPFATITNFKDTQKLSCFHKENFYNPKNSVLIGARDLDELEIKNLEEAGIKIFTTDDIKEYGVSYVMDKAFKIASNNTIGVHISYDIDVIDPKLAPGVSIPAINGINIDEAYEIMDEIVKNKENIKSLDLVEYNPDTDIDNKTMIIAQNLLKKFIN